MTKFIKSQPECLFQHHFMLYLKTALEKIKYKRAQINKIKF